MKDGLSAPETITFNRQFESKYGPQFVYDIIMEDGTQGQFTTTKNPQTKFTIGQQVKYTVEQITDKRGNTYNKIDIAKEDFKGGKGGYASSGGNSKKSPGVQASILASVCLDCANIVIDKMNVEEKIAPDLKTLHALSNKFYDYIVNKCGADEQLRINYQSRLKEVCNHFFEYPQLKIETSDQILQYVDVEVAYLQSKMPS